MSPASGDSESGAAPGAGDSLSTYRAKRSADRSPEPVGTVSPTPGHLFVVHKHAASHLHFDLRLEMDGVLKSWAVPKGPSYDVADKRLAVRVEDHPLEYGDFEGVIPKGNYGAGGVIVWDRGEWTPLEDWREGLEKGKLLFELKGYKLRGKWTLVKIKKSERDWLFIKERDSWVKSPGDQFDETSVLSGLTVEEVKAGERPGGNMRADLLQAGAERAKVDARSVKVMLAQTRDGAFTDENWVFELKLDGYRMLACKSRGEALLLSRNGNDFTDVFPEIARAVRALHYEHVILDGEVVVLDLDGKPSFSRLQRRGRLSAEREIRNAAVELPATYFAFDLIALDDFDLRNMGMTTRHDFMMRVVPRVGAIQGLEYIPREGEAFLKGVEEMGLEGIIAKRAASPYRAGRSADWLKIKAIRTGDFVVVGYTAPRGSRSGLGALQLADYVNGQLVYVGRVGTGFNDAFLQQLAGMLEPEVQQSPPCLGPLGTPGAEPLPASRIPETKTTTWVRPMHVVEVRYTEITPDWLLRHAAFLRMREDKIPEECQRQGWESIEAPEEVPSTAEPATRTVSFSNLRKVYWPRERYTKGDLIEYYRNVSRWLLPYLRDRPLVMTRYPDGIEGKMFYQKDAPEFAPDWIRTVPIWSEDTQRAIRYFVCDDEETLLYIANLGTIPLHMWASRVGTLELCDWCVIDLDPKEAPFSDVIRCAQVLHAVCQDIGLPDYVKTTGKTGLHILLPLARSFTYEQSRTLGELLARLVLKETGDIATITRHVTKRGDKVYLDYLQNRHGQTIVAPFSVRPLPGATVSMPLRWDEVEQGLDPREFTIRTAVDRMEQLGADPGAPVLEQAVDLESVLSRVAKLA
jgi:bifunctional non-homologous end joining protein LigD